MKNILEKIKKCLKKIKNKLEYICYSIIKLD